MKKLIIFLIFGPFSICFAQCDQILKESVGNGFMYHTDFELPVQAVKQIKLGDRILKMPSDTLYFLVVELTNDFLASGKFGVKVILDENYIIENLDLQIKVSLNDSDIGGKYKYSSIVPLKKVDIIKLGVHNILGYQLHTFRNSLSYKEALQFKNEIRCLYRAK